jgi:hypothetical protein
MARDILHVGFSPDYDPIGDKELYGDLFGGSSREYMWALKEAAQLFRSIAERLSEDEAKQIFLNMMLPRNKQRDSKERERKFQNRLCLFYYDGPGEKSVARAARIIARINEESAREYRVGPRGSRSVETIEKHLRRLLAQRQKSDISK